MKLNAIKSIASKHGSTSDGLVGVRHTFNDAQLIAFAKEIMSKSPCRTQEDDGWTRVSDRLPDDGATVLSLDFDGDYDILYGSTIKCADHEFEFWRALPAKPIVAPTDSTARTE
jgi:hypothetical protein